LHTLPVKPTEFSYDETFRGRILSRQGRLSRHKVTVGEPAVGSPPKNKKNRWFFLNLLETLLGNALKEIASGEIARRKEQR